MSQRRPPFPPLLVLTLGVAAVSTASLFIRYAQESAPSLVIAAWRLTLATIILAPLVLGEPSRRAELRLLTRREVGLGVVCGFFLALHFASWISSLAYTSVASSVVLVDTTPLWVALIAARTLGERISRGLRYGLVLAVGGGIVVGLSDACHLQGGNLVCPPWQEFAAGKALFGDLLALVGALTAAVYLVIGRHLRAKVSLVVYIFTVYGTAALVLILLAWTAGLSFFGYPPLTYLWFLALALFPQLLGHSSYNYALAYLPAAYVSLALLGEPIGSTFLAYLFLGEVPSFLKLVGAGLILVGIYIASTQGIAK